MSARARGFARCLCLALGAALALALGSPAQTEEAAEGSPFPLPPEDLERVMRDPPAEIRAHEWVAGLRYRVYKLETRFPEAEPTLTIKWKAATRGLESRNNTPRREIAAYRIQKWFLEPSEYLVPTTTATCIPLAVYAAIDPDAQPNPAVSRCVFGTQSIWLQNVRPTGQLLDAERFQSEPRYAKHLEHYNLLTYLIENNDTRPANVLVAADPADGRTFSIDNGVSFGEWIYNPLRAHWSVFRVPRLPAAAIERLRAVDEKDLQALRVVAQFRLDDEGLLHAVPPSAPFEAQQPVRTRDDVLQLGLVPSEIEALRARLAELIDRADAGLIPLH